MRSKIKLTLKGILNRSVLTLFAAILLCWFSISLFPQDSEAFGLNRKQFSRKYKLANTQFDKCRNYIRKNNFAAAEKTLKKCLKIMPQHVNSHYALSQVYFRTGRYREALHHITQAETHYGSIAQMLTAIRRGEAHQAKQKKAVLRQEIDSYLGALQIDGACGLPSYIGTLQGKVRDMEEKERLGTLSIGQIPPDFSYLHGNIFFKMKQYNEALRQYLTAVGTNPYFGKAYNNLANLYYMAKDYPKALASLERAEEIGAEYNQALKTAITGAMKTSGITARAGKSSLPEGVKRFAVTVGSSPNTFEENTYIFFSPATRDAVIIDPGARDERIESFIKKENLTVRAILNTHGHGDHIAANHVYASLYNVQVWAHAQDAPYYSGENAENKPKTFFSKEDPLELQGLNIKIIHTPGHSPGSVCYLIEGILFSGDTLFRQGIGRTWGKSEEEKEQKTRQLTDNIENKLFPLPPGTVVFPGHGAPTTIGDEKSHNPFF